MVGMIKQSVLKQARKGALEGGGGGGLKAKFYIGERVDIIIIGIIVLSYFSYAIFSDLIFNFIKLKHLGLDDNRL